MPFRVVGEAVGEQPVGGLAAWLCFPASEPAQDGRDMLRPHMYGDQLAAAPHGELHGELHRGPAVGCVVDPDDDRPVPVGDRPARRGAHHDHGAC